MNTQTQINVGVLGALALVIVTLLVARWVKGRLAGQTEPVFTLDEISEEITYQIPLIPPSLRSVDEDPIPYTFTDAGVALAWSQAAAGLDDVEPVDRSVFDPDVYYGWADR